MNEETQIRPYKWSAWDFEIYSRDRNGKTEYAFITTEHKWVDMDIDGDYVLVPIEQHKLLAPLFKGMTDSTTDMYFVIDGVCGVGMSDGGYIDMEFSEPHLKTEYETLYQKLDEETKDLSSEGELQQDIFDEMGFKTHEDRMQMSDDYIRTVVKFNNCQRKLGE